MRLTRRRRDGIDTDVWQAVVKAASFGALGDAGSLGRTIDQLGALGHRGHLAPTYVDFVLRYLLQFRFGHKPSGDEIHNFARQHAQAFEKTVVSEKAPPEALLEASIRKVYDLPVTVEVNGIPWFINLCVAAGIAAGEQVGQLDSLRPKLASYLSTHHPEDLTVG